MQLLSPRAMVVVVVALHLYLTSSFTSTSTSTLSHANMTSKAKWRLRVVHRRLSSITNDTLGTTPVDILGTDILSGLPLGVTQYLIQIGVGTPPKTQYLIFDSGSDLTWIQCNPCKCYPQPDPIFNPAGSASFATVACGSAVCDGLRKPGCHQGQCQYNLTYGDMSNSMGTLVRETLTLELANISNIIMGCAHENSGSFVGTDGLLGIGKGPMSLLSQLQLRGLAGSIFSYCLPHRASTAAGSSGWLEFGHGLVGELPQGPAWVPLVHNRRHPSLYYVGLSGLRVGHTRVPIPESIFRLTRKGDGGVVLDSGTKVSRLPKLAYKAFRNAFIAQAMNLTRASKKYDLDTCYNISSGVDSVHVPSVFLNFSTGLTLSLPPSNVLVEVDVDIFCLAFAPSSSKTLFSILGNTQLAGIQISIDTAAGLVGFGPNICGDPKNSPHCDGSCTPSWNQTVQRNNSPYPLLVTIISVLLVVVGIFIFMIMIYYCFF